MKIAESAARVVDSSGLTEESNFQILATAQSFRILSSGLYSDKISAVLREVGCNAMDSHIAAGLADKPIEIKLPTRLSSEFYIKDYGLGLSHEEIISLYTTYFSSNKGNNNDLTGAFGLGSKSPFSYTDSFSITTAQNGKQRTYSAYIGKGGSPVIALLSEQPASDAWPHGVMVSFPVKPHDISEFEQKARQVYQWFSVKPVHPGNLESPYADPEIASKGTNFFFLKDPHGNVMHLYGGRPSYSSNTARVLMGNVAYPLDAKRLGSDNKIVNGLISAGIHIRMPLGSVMPTASREDLEYDERTRKNLGSALVTAGIEMAKTIADQVIMPANNEWERHRRTRTLMEKIPGSIYEALPTMLSLLNLPKTEVRNIISCCADRAKTIDKWIGGEVYQQSTVAQTTAVVDKKESYHVWIVEQSWTRRRRAALASDRIIRSEVIRGQIKRGKLPEDAEIPYTFSPEIYYVDDVNAYGRIKELISSEQDRIIMVQAMYDEGKPTLEAYAKRVADALGGIPVKPVSSLPPLSREEREKREKVKQPVLSRDAKEKLYAQEEVEFVDASEGEPRLTKYAFGDIPDNAKFYLPAPTGRNPLSYLIPTEPYARQLVNARIMDLVHAFNALRTLGAPLPEIGGYIIPVQAQGRKFRLIERGWQSLPDVIAKCLKNPKVAKALKGKFTNLPDLSLTSERVTNYRGQIYGHIGELCLTAYQSGEFSEWFFKALKSLPTLEAIVTPLWDNNVLSVNNKTATAALQTIQDVLTHNFIDVTLSRETQEEYEERLYKQYPRLRFLDKDIFARNSAVCDKTALLDLLKFIFET